MKTSALEEKVETLLAQVAELAERQRRRDELLDEMMPILKLVMASGSERLSSLEQRGYFDFGRELLGVIDHVVQGYAAEDVAKLGDSVVSILDTVRSLTQPHVLKVVGEIGNVVEQSEEADPVGPMAVLRASRDEEVQRGMAVMLEVLRHVGRGAAQLDRRARLRRRLASRNVSGSAPPTAPPRRAPAATAARASRVPEAPSPPASRAKAPALSVPQIEGVAFTEDGFMVDASQWTREIAETIAKSLGCGELGDKHWKLIEFARAEYEQTGASPNVRRLAKGSGIGTKEIYAMFPKAPGKCAAMIAGLPKPVGCI